MWQKVDSVEDRFEVVAMVEQRRETKQQGWRRGYGQVPGV
jgi:hypothetical protein